MEDRKFKCSRIISKDEVTKTGAKNMAWWNRLFEIMVKEVCVPPHKRVEVLQKIFPREIFKCICKALGLEIDPVNELLSEISDVNIRELAFHFIKIDDSKESLVIRPTKFNKTQSLTYTTRYNVQKRNLKFNILQKYFEKEHYKKKEVDKDIMESINLAVMAKLITEKIAFDFIDWLKNLEKNIQDDIVEIFKFFKLAFFVTEAGSGGDNSPESSTVHAKKHKPPVAQKQENRKYVREIDTLFDFQQILKLFEVGVSNEATNSTFTNVKEIPIRGLRQVFNLAERDAAEKKVFEEAKRMRRLKSLVPQDEPYTFTKSDYVKKLDSMEFAFKDIMHLRSVKGYCKWLVDNSNNERPEFLINNNMFDINNLKISISQESIKTSEEF